MRYLLSFFIFIFSPSVFANVIECRVVGVVDGDTIKVVCPTENLIKVRLANIDAPESKQDFGTRAKHSLADMCYGKQATINMQNKDKYGRVIGVVSCDGLEANKEQVKRGMAWVYKKYNNDPSLYKVQDKAEIDRIGLWENKNPLPPWEFRKIKKHIKSSF